MGLLDSFPHRCTIRHRVRAKGSLAGSKDSFENDQTNDETGVECWEQAASQAEIATYEKRGMSVTRKVYFTTDPAVTVRHQILITKRSGVVVAAPVPLDVRTEALPDAAAGMGAVFKVFVEGVTSSSN